MKSPLIKADDRWFVRSSRHHVMTIFNANPLLFNCDIDAGHYMEVIDVEEFNKQHELILVMEAL